jgi:hypothetical protein
MEVEFKSSGLFGFSGMTTDIFNYLKFIFTKIGLAMTMLCLFIYLLLLLITGSLTIVGKILTVLALILFCILSWLQWFRIKKE